MAETRTLSVPDRPASAHGASQAAGTSSPLPRVTISFCTQCKWMLRAAYFAQELLSTFSTALGEVALQPATGGVFVVQIYYADPTPTSTSATAQAASNPIPTIQHRVLWDRKKDGGFPETKELKRRVRDVIEPDRNLGHVDRDYPRQHQPPSEESPGRPDASEKGAPPEAGQQQQRKSEAEEVVAQGQQTEGNGANLASPSAQDPAPSQKTQEYCEDCQ